jgi:ATP-dependent protease ClpP protease subunit
MKNNKELNEMESFAPVHFVESRPIYTHHLYLSEHIAEAKWYTKALQMINTCGEHDTVIHHINTPGGYVSTGIQYINAMTQSAARQVCSLEGEVASMGSTIFLAGDEWIVSPLGSMMIHNYTGGTYGKGHEQVVRVLHDKEWYARVWKQVYIPFLTEEEVDDVIDGKDLYFMADEIMERLENVANIRNQEHEEEQKSIIAENKAIDEFLEQYRADLEATDTVEDDKGDTPPEMLLEDDTK